MIRPEHYTAPAAWACLAMYGDESGLEPEDAKAAAAWLESLPGPVVAVDAEGDDSPGFMRWHDAASVAPYAADCALYTIHKEESDQ